MSNQSTQIKQQYLRQNIIDAGFDAEDFVQYCTNQHSLLDLQDWSVKKLKQVVLLYVSMKNTQKSKIKNIINEKQDQWSEFKQSSSESHQVNKVSQQNQLQINHNVTKAGHLVFSETDWSIFLGSNPGLNSIQNNDNRKETIQKINKAFQLKQKDQKGQISLKSQLKNTQLGKIGLQNEKQTTIQQNGLDNLDKQNPLSPPSKDIKKETMNISSLIEENSLKNQNKGPINFINLKILTSKIKQMPKLPQINDIIITKTQQVSRNFLQSDYTLYYIHFTPGEHTIQRKFSDLRRLRSILQNMYPHIRLPYLEPEGWLTSSEGKDTQTLAKYKWMIIDFLKHIALRNQQLKNCPLVRKFCGFSTSTKNNQQYQPLSKQDLKKVFQAYQNIPKPKTIGQLCLHNNLIVLPPSNDGQKTLNNTLNLMQEIDHEYEKLRKKFDTLFYNYELLAKSMFDVSSSFEILQNLIKKYNFDNDEAKQFRIYEGMRQICTKMQNTMNEHYVILKTRIKNIIRYEKDNMMTMKEIFDFKNKIHAEYAKQGYPTLSKSSQSGGELEIDSKISIEQVYKNNKNNLCVQEIFWSYNTKLQISDYWQELRKKINEQLTLISYEQLDNQNDNLNFWNSMIKKCVI